MHRDSLAEARMGFSGGQLQVGHVRLGRRFLRSIYGKTFTYVWILAYRNYHFRTITKKQSRSRCPWDKYILHLLVISWVALTLDMAHSCIHTYDVGLCRLLVSDIVGCGRPQGTGRASTAARVFFCAITKAESRKESNFIQS